MNGPLAALTIQQFLNDHLANWLPFKASGDLVALMAFLTTALIHAALLINLFWRGLKGAPAEKEISSSTAK